jgi:hypothetical protein
MSMSQKSFLTSILLFLSVSLPLEGYAAMPAEAAYAAVGAHSEIVLSAGPRNSVAHPKSDLTNSDSLAAAPMPVAVLRNTMGGFTFQLSFEPQTLQVGKVAAGTLVVTDAKGQPVTKLEPLLGAFVQLVGFENNFKEVIYAHPMGKAPANASDRGGPEVKFQLEPTKPGAAKLFAQVVIKGKELLVPFDVTVRPA